MKSITLSLFLLVGQLVSGVPSSEGDQDLPSDVPHIAFDDVRGLGAYHRNAFMGRFAYGDSVGLGESKRDDVAKCRPLSVQAVLDLPGWKKIRAYADNSWGKGGEIFTNPEDDKKSPAMICVTADIVKVSYDEKQPINCTFAHGKVRAQAIRTNGSINSGVINVLTNTGTWTVMESSTLSPQGKFGVTLGFDKILEVSPEITVGGEFKDENSESFTTTKTIMNTVGSSFAVPDGKECTMIYTEKSCGIEGSGEVRMVATGWVGFRYDRPTHGGDTWFVNIDAVLHNIDDKSGFAKILGNLAVEAEAEFNTTCNAIQIQ